MAANLKPNNPADDCFQITPNDGVDIAPARSLMIGASGTLKITTAAGNTVTLSNVPAGLFPVSVTRVWSTGTTAAGIVGIV